MNSAVISCVSFCVENQNYQNKTWYSTQANTIHQKQWYCIVDMKCMYAIFIRALHHFKMCDRDR